MRKSSISVLFVLALSLAGLAACGEDDACAELTSKIASATKASASAIKSWMDQELTGPDDEKLSGDERGQACKMIMGEKDALTGYVEKAKVDLAATR
jgi:hypothetical protein